ncbi:putative lectin protein [Emiliania huxleyi virus 86]|uniref:Putative lectin protein n=1 Tax=Emiliania huxleyi virus 86 (isolate United Kingdom/English Channel/1999) TaxID=654925 RepID=Q4A2N6_EHV8U|nr:putative lectin protein [Emiliania huxleyi virus 86]AHA54854.1 putative lectin protein [Emiliania huxleyi virus 145]AHA55874.1 putative lectin protein [Emiliania huxleyi virus 164]CAI65670.1 putative lectin protein [Emiliania huxleyi virus 86]
MGKSKSKASPKPKDNDSSKKEKETPPTETSPPKVASKGRGWIQIITSMIIKLLILAILSACAYAGYVAYEIFKPTPTSLDRGDAVQLQKEYNSKAYEYKVSLQEKSWEEHEASARKWGGHLVSFTAEEEYYKILQQIDDDMNKSENLAAAQQLIVDFSHAYKNGQKHGYWTGGRFKDESRSTPPSYSENNAKTSQFWSWSDNSKWGYGMSLWEDRSPDGDGSCVLMKSKRRGDMEFLNSEDCTRRLAAIYKRRK